MKHLIGMAAGALLLLAPSALAAPAATGVQEAFLLTRGPGYQLNVEQIVAFPSGTKGAQTVGLLRGFQGLSVNQGQQQGLGLDKAGSTLVVTKPNPAQQIDVAYTLSNTDSSVALRLPAPGPIASVEFLAGPDVYPVPITNNNISYAGTQKARGLPVTVFQAGNVPGGSDFTVGLTLGVPGSKAAGVVLGILVAVGLLGVVAIFWFKSRLRSMV